MAKPISFTKRDLEKKKQEKRLAKQQKKEERKSNGTSSFEDMIAYVDENGKHTIFRLDAHYSQPYLCAVTFNNNDYGKRKSKLSGGI